jgi:hypothetical protein
MEVFIQIMCNECWITFLAIRSVYTIHKKYSHFLKVAIVIENEVIFEINAIVA